ncbi:MAG TPA: MFS transporter [Bryobacteraceae bacterium]|nr:MFS transporter [Bryobacteraceae bacterium]
MRTKGFYGWWITAATFVTFGISVGIPYYNLPFFYDYYQKTFDWSRSEITLGFPVAAILTLWVGPLLIPRLDARKSIVIGTGLTLLALTGFSHMGGNLVFYYALWILYTMGYILSGPIPHQVIVSQWFRRNRGKAMGLVYVGVGVIASLGSILVKELTEAFNFRIALQIIAAIMLIAWPIAFFVIKLKPSDKGQFPDGDEKPPEVAPVKPCTYRYLLGKYQFWLLLVGSFCSIGAIGSINIHMKFVFFDQGFKDQGLLDATWRTANVAILWSSIIGRVVVGSLADRFPMKYVMFSTYFVTAATIPLLLTVRPPGAPWAFAVLFGLAMGADYMLIPLMAARQFGVNNLAKAMAIILPSDTIGQTWLPYLVAQLRERSVDYTWPLYSIFFIALIGATSIALLPKRGAESEEIHLSSPGRATT